jgi:hypothetical protein
MRLGKARTRIEDPLEEARRTRRTRMIAVSALCGVLLVTGLAGALSGKIPGVPLREGPLDGGGADVVTARLKNTETAGSLWGTLHLWNPSRDPITLESVTLAHNPDGVRQISQPYLWDDSRTAMLGFGSLEYYALPLPEKWKIPNRQRIENYVLKPADENSEPDVEVLFEFAKPSRASMVGDVTVQYRIGWLAFRKTFPVRLHLCPAEDLAPCKQ